MALKSAIGILSDLSILHVKGGFARIDDFRLENSLGYKRSGIIDITGYGEGYASP